MIECQSEKECLEKILAKECDGTFYRHTHVISIPAELEDGHFKIDLHKIRGDITGEFECNVPFTIEIGNNEYSINRVLSICLAFHTAHVCISVEKSKIPKEIVFSKNVYYYSNEIRRAIVLAMNPNSILDGEIHYQYGMAGPHGTKR